MTWLVSFKSLTMQKLCLLWFFCTSHCSRPFISEYAWLFQSVFEYFFYLGLTVFFIWAIFNTLDTFQYFHYNYFIRSKQKVSKTKSRSETYPTKYPHGWFPLLWSSELKKGAVMGKDALGKHFVIFRTQHSGEVAVLDAFCPHVGADLSTNGTVCGDLLQCCFHRWQFDVHGQCQHIPYLKAGGRIPANANAKCYPSTEYHGMVCVYYGNQIPLYELPVQLDVQNTREYKYYNSLDYGLINMNIQEFCENAADWQHFAPIHGALMFPFTQIVLPVIHRWLSIHHTPGTLLGNRSKDKQLITDGLYDQYMTGGEKEKKYFMYFLANSHLRWNNKRLKNTAGAAAVTFCGPAGVCIFRLMIPAVNPNAYIVIFQSHLPEDEMHLRVRFHWYAHKSLPSILVWYVVGNWVAQWTNDIAIWENKVFLQKPCLVKGDGPVMQVRRWFKQFCLDQDVKGHESAANNHSSSCVLTSELKEKKMDW